MKAIWHIALLLSLTALSIPCKAGGDDVLYLKDGTIYRGKVLKEGSTFKIQISRYNILIVPKDDVAIVHIRAGDGPLAFLYDTITKEYHANKDDALFYHPGPGPGFFFQGQFCVGLIDGLRMTFGYRFKYYLAVGLGAGWEYAAPLNPGAPWGAAGGYCPVFAYLTGDILKQKVTPFYSFEAGYDFPMYQFLQTPIGDGVFYSTPPSYWHYYGGITTGAGFGFRVYSDHRVNFIMSLNMNVGYLRIRSTDFHNSTNSPYYGYYTTTTANWLSLQPSVRFGFRF